MKDTLPKKPLGFSYPPDIDRENEIIISRISHLVRHGMKSGTYILDGFRTSWDVVVLDDSGGLNFEVQEVDLLDANQTSYEIKVDTNEGTLVYRRKLNNGATQSAEYGLNGTLIKENGANPEEVKKIKEKCLMVLAVTYSQAEQQEA